MTEPTPPAAAPSDPAATTLPPHAPSINEPRVALPKPPRRQLSTVAVLVSALGLGLIGGMGGYAIADAVNRGANVPPLAPADFTVAEGSVSAVAQAVLPSVVSIESTVGGVQVGSGSGFVFSADGYVVTNNHVIASSDGTVTVVYADGVEEEGVVVGATSDYDIAVVRVEREGLVPLVLADSDGVQVGEPVIAIGSPLGLDATVTTGIVSATHRPVTGTYGFDAPVFIDALQTDAAINPGNSGGPLLNSEGQVIGINSAVAVLPGANAANGSGSVGLGFAIPSNQAYRTALEIIETGTATFPVVGVLLDEFYVGRGVKVLEDIPEQDVLGVTPGSPADLAGIQAGDVITAIDGRPVTRPSELIVSIRAMAPGDTVVLTIQAGGESRDVSVELTVNTSVEFQDGSDQAPDDPTEGP